MTLSCKQKDINDKLFLKSKTSFKLEKAGNGTNVQL